MKTLSSLIKSVIITSISTIVLSACGNGATPATDNNTTSHLAYTLPNSTIILANGTQVSVLNPVLSVSTGKITSTILKIQGGEYYNSLVLSAVILSANQQVASTDSLIVKFDKSNIITESELATNESNIVTRTILIDASNASPGQYQIKINGNNLDDSKTLPTTVNSMSVTVSESGMVQATYLDYTDTSSLAQITSSAYQASNLILFAFDNDVNTTSISQDYANVMQNAITNNQSSATKYFLSLGGATAGSSIYNVDTIDTVVANITTQIHAYNQQLIGGQITGVDLDLEQGIDESTITGLALGFKNNGFLISIAPQVAILSGSTVDPTNPTNLALSSGGNNNQYGTVVKNGYADYIMLQTYNNGSFTINGFSESQVDFFSAIAQAINTTVHSDCVDSTQLCILDGTQIAIGEVSNAGSSGSIYNLFGSNGQTAYNQSDILTALNSQIPDVLASYSHVSGIMQWSYNGDYNPTEWGDYYATPGAFTSDVFGAMPVIATPPFILQVSNTATVSGTQPYGSATLVVNNQYLVYGNSSGYPLTPQYLSSDNYQQWGTSTSAVNSGGTVAYSQNFDTLFSNGLTSFYASKIIINTYPNATTPVSSPTNQYACLNSDGSVMSYTFEAGVKYNLQINPVYQSCFVGVVGSL